MKLRILVFLIIFSVACKEKNYLPKKVTERITLETDPYFFEQISNNELTVLDSFLIQYNEGSSNFQLDKFKNYWKEFSSLNDISQFTENELLRWIEITGLLFELTGEEHFIANLEYSNNLLKSNTEYLSSFILTKNTDHIHVNLFQPTEINYDHSLGGKVKFVQQTDFPKSGNVKLQFSMNERRYVELYVRIPKWAEGASVTVKKVKYLATPGSYCKIAKKWKNGDIVEVWFPENIIPDYIKHQI